MSELALLKKGQSRESNVQMVLRGTKKNGVLAIDSGREGPGTLTSEYRGTLVVGASNIQNCCLVIEPINDGSGSSSTNRGLPCVVVFLNKKKQRKVTINDIPIYMSDDFKQEIGTLDIDCKITDPGETFHGTKNSTANDSVMLYYEISASNYYIRTRLYTGFLNEELSGGE